MADPIFEFDPVSEDATNAPLLLSNTANYGVMAFDPDSAQQTIQWASSVDTEGALPASAKDENRTVSFTVECLSAASLRTLQAKVGKISREQGTLKYTLPNGEVVIFDLLARASFKPTFDQQYFLLSGVYCTVDFSFTAKPYGRGTEITTLSDHVETTLPLLVFTETGIKGDAWGTARLVIDNDEATRHQAWAAWGIQSRFYDSASSAALFFEAEGRTAVGGSATAAGPTGASGAGSNVMRNTSLTTTPQAILSTQATGGGAHLSHVGVFRVFARVQVPSANAGTVSVALEWAAGDYLRAERNGVTTLAPAAGGVWRLVDLGLVTLEKVLAGTQRWEGRFLASSTVSGDDIDIDWLTLIPVTEGYGEVAAVYDIPSPSTFAARDEFDQTAGNLTGKTAPIGGTWSGSGDAFPFTIDATNHRAIRALSTGAPSKQFARIGATSWSDVVVQADVRCALSVSFTRQGVFARYVDTSNWVALVVEGGTAFCYVTICVAGVETVVGSVPNVRVDGGAFQRLTLYVSATGTWIAQRDGIETARGSSSVLATGGTLATGGAGLFDDAGLVPPYPTNNFDNFAVWVPPSDAAIFATQSVEVRSNAVRRKDAGGTLWVQPSSYEGSYLTVPPAGAEARTLRVAVKTSRSLPTFGDDSGTDDISAKLFYTPRYLVVPEP